MRLTSGFSDMGMVVLLVAFATVAGATTVPRLPLEEIVAQADQIVSGTVQSAEVTWDKGHRLLWTKYRVAVSESLKGKAAATVTIAEPGGQLEGKDLVVSEAVKYSVGERVTLLLRRFPDGEYRTIGWSQGKFSLGRDGRMHAAGGDARLEGTSPETFRTRVKALIGAAEKTK